VKAAARGLQEATFTIASYIWDLRIALQNKLLGGLFEYRVPVRRPTDPRYKAVTLEEAARRPSEEGRSAEPVNEDETVASPHGEFRPRPPLGREPNEFSQPHAPRVVFSDSSTLSGEKSSSHSSRWPPESPRGS